MLPWSWPQASTSAIIRRSISTMRARNSRLFRATADNDVRGHFQPSYAFRSADWCPPTPASISTPTTPSGWARWDAYSADDTYISPIAIARSPWHRRSRRRSRYARPRRGMGAFLAPAAGQSRAVGRRHAAGAGQIDDLDPRLGARLCARAGLIVEPQRSPGDGGCSWPCGTCAAGTA